MTTVPQGELFRARTHIRQSRANNIAHRTQKHGDVETNNTTAHPQQGTTETAITSAPENCTKIAHFSPAKAMAVSTPHRHQRAKATAVSDNRVTSPAAPKRGARGWRRGLALEKSHAIRLDEVSIMSENVAIPTLQIHDLKESRGNCMRNWGELSNDVDPHQHNTPHWCGGRRKAWLRCPWAAAGPGRTTSRRAERHQPRRPHWCGGRRRDRRAWLRCPWAAAGPGRASSRRAERSSRRGRRAGGPPPTGAPSSPARKGGRGARNTRGATSKQATTSATQQHVVSYIRALRASSSRRRQ